MNGTVKEELIVKLAVVLSETFTEQELDFMVDEFTLLDYLEALNLTAPSN